MLGRWGTRLQKAQYSLYIEKGYKAGNKINKTWLKYTYIIFQTIEDYLEMFWDFCKEIVDLFKLQTVIRSVS